MPRLLRLLALACLALALPAHADPGGEGVFTVSGKGLGLQNATRGCFKPSHSETIVEVCGELRIGWKLWSLLGDPVGDYVLAWKITSVVLQAPDNTGRWSFDPARLPAQYIPASFRRSVDAIELTIEATARLANSPGAAGARVAFNTGAPVRANGTPSLTSPGSPKWSELFFTTAFLDPGCSPRVRQYLPEAQAKSAFVEDMRLEDLVICPGSSLTGLDSLEQAIARVCTESGTRREYPYCPKPKSAAAVAAMMEQVRRLSPQTTAPATTTPGAPRTPPGPSASTSVMDLMDNAADRPRVLARLEQDRSRFREQAAQVCRTMMSGINACYAKAQCMPPDESGGATVAACESIPRRPEFNRLDYPILRSCPPGGCRDSGRGVGEDAAEEGRRKVRAEQEVWDRRWGTLKSACDVRAKQAVAFAQCEPTLRSRCNPAALTQDRCVADAMNRGPTEDEARAALRRETPRPAME